VPVSLHEIEKTRARFLELRDAPYERLLYEVAKLAVRDGDVLKGVEDALVREVRRRYILQTDMAAALRCSPRMMNYHLKKRGLGTKLGNRANRDERHEISPTGQVCEFDPKET
jgi:hypothetical protein